MASHNADSQLTKDLGWIDALIAAAREYGGPDGIDLDAPMRTPDRWLPDLSSPEFDYLDEAT